MGLKTLRFWVDEIFPEGAWHEDPAERTYYKTLNRKYTLTLKKRGEWEVDLLEGDHRSPRGVVFGIDLHLECPSIPELRDWLWEAYRVFAGLAQLPTPLTTEGPLSGEGICYHPGTMPLDMTTDLSKLDWGRGQAALIAGKRRSGKTLLAFRMARDFALGGARVILHVPHRSQALETFRSRWGFEFPSSQVFQHREESLEFISQANFSDLVVVDIQVPGLNRQPQLLAESMNTRILWTFEVPETAVEVPQRVTQTIAKVFESHGEGLPFSVTKSRVGPQNFRVLPGLTAPD